MAVHKPYSGVIGWEGNNQPPITGKKSSIPTNWVLVLQGSRSDVESAGARTKDEVVVTVKVNWMRHDGVLLDDPISPLLALRDLNDVIFLREVVVTVHNILNCWLPNINVNRTTVDSPQN